VVWQIGIGRNHEFFSPRRTRGAGGEEEGRVVVADEDGVKESRWFEKIIVRFQGTGRWVEVRRAKITICLRFPANNDSTTKAAPTPVVAPVVAPIEEEPAAVEETKPLPDTPQPKKVIRAEIDAERARKLGERFSVTIDPQRFSSKKVEREVYRIEKPIRMRIHRQCHKCDTIFGGNKICASCDHVRCKSCPRSPPKKAEKKDKKPAKPVDVPGVLELEADTYWNLQQETVLTRPNPKPGRQPLVRKKPMQRVRRTCCECSTLFTANSKTCASCSHGRCVDCPRDP
jgi:hypothetical protein